jgi:drug/metabolite transporter (DMT)-like permease
MKIKNYRLNLLGLVAGAILISFSGVWVKISHVTPTVSAFYRVFFGGVILLVMALVRREVKWQGRQNALLILVCSLFFALDLLFYHYSIHLVGPGLGTILPNFQVFILTAVGVIILKEKLRLSFLAAVPLAVTGLFLIVGIQWHGLSESYRLGVVFGLTAALCYTAFLLFLRKLQSDQIGKSRFYVLMIVSLITALFLAAEVCRTGASFQIPDIQSLAALLALGGLSQVVGWLLITNALPGIRASLSGLILLLQPALAFVWDVLLFQRPTTLVNWLGVVLALAAIYLGTVNTSKQA